MAKEWAVGETHDGFANRYEFDLTGLKVVDLSGKGYTVLHWLSVLLENRVFDMRRDINAARADAFFSLARALHCPPEALLERV